MSSNTNNILAIYNELKGNQAILNSRTQPMKDLVKATLKIARQHDFLAISNETGHYVNLYGKYDYMEFPYFVSQEIEAAGLEVSPTCKEMLDAYITPILLEKAKSNDISTPEFYISNGFFEPPVIIDPINPFMIKSRTVLSANHVDRIARSMTRNFTYAICCQELPAGSKVKRFRAVLGWSVNRQFRNLSSVIWQVFKIPLARVRVIVLVNGDILLSDISHLPFDELNESEIHYLLENVKWAE